jgi:hypothetical protein
MMLVRDRNESILPLIIIGFVFSTVVGIAFVSLEISYRSTPNTFDLIADALDTTQTYEAPKTRVPPAPDRPPPETEKTMVAAESL